MELTRFRGQWLTGEIHLPPGKSWQKAHNPPKISVMENSVKTDTARVLSRISELDTGGTEDRLEPREMLTLAVEHMTLQKHKEKIENWILSNFFSHYNRSQPETFQWTMRGKPPGEPDYLVFSQPGGQPLFVEVTELLDKGRKRGDEYKAALEEAKKTGDYLSATEMAPPPPDYEQHLVEQSRYVLEKKFAKPYPRVTWLIVYFNPTSFTLGWNTSSQSETLDFAIKILAEAARTLNSPDKIEQVWVLTNDGRIGKIPL
jgi:hypothetical protein